MKNLAVKRSLRETAEAYGAEFMKRFNLDSQVPNRCEWNCLLWLTEHWAEEARRAQIRLQQAKEQLGDAKKTELEALLSDAQFQNTIAQVYSKLFGGKEVNAKLHCPSPAQHQDFLRRGTLANAFVTMLRKATFYAMLQRHPLDSGLINDEYNDVYGINLTNYEEFERSFSDGRFQKLFKSVTGSPSAQG